MKPIVLLGEAFGQSEVRTGTGFCGASGIELLRMLNEVSILEFTSDDYDYLNKFYNTGDPILIDTIWRLHPEVVRTNVFNFHPPGNDIASLCGP
ncbi:MAG: hypothetical protein WC763_07105, partial [Candidatus Paceibacterota bacterium]